MDGRIRDRVGRSPNFACSMPITIRWGALGALSLASILFSCNSSSGLDSGDGAQAPDDQGAVDPEKRSDGGHADAAGRDSGARDGANVDGSPDAGDCAAAPDVLTGKPGTFSNQCMQV